MKPSLLGGAQPHRNWLNGGTATAFLHVMKTGGTSFNTFFAAHVDTAGHPLPATWDAVLTARTAAARAPGGAAGAAPLRAISGHFLIGDILQHLPQANIATLLRNPTDRAMSLYRYLGSMSAGLRARMGPARAAIAADAAALPVEDWLARHGEALRSELRDVYVFSLGGTYGDLIAGVDPETLLAAAQSNLSHLSFVGLTERMQDAILLAALDNDIDITPAAPRLNVTPPGPGHADNAAVLEPFVALDWMLYRQARRLFRQRLAARIGAALTRIGAAAGHPGMEAVDAATDRLLPLPAPPRGIDRALAFHDALFGAAAPGPQDRTAAFWVAARAAPVRGLRLHLAHLGDVPSTIPVTVGERIFRIVPGPDPRAGDTPESITVLDLRDDGPVPGTLSRQGADPAGSRAAPGRVPLRIALTLPGGNGAGQSPVPIGLDLLYE